MLFESREYRTLIESSVFYGNNSNALCEKRHELSINIIDNLNGVASECPTAVRVQFLRRFFLWPANICSSPEPTTHDSRNSSLGSELCNYCKPIATLWSFKIIKFYWLDSIKTELLKELLGIPLFYSTWIRGKAAIKKVHRCMLYSTIKGFRKAELENKWSWDSMLKAFNYTELESDSSINRFIPEC